MNRYKYYSWESETEDGRPVHLGAIAQSELEARRAILRTLVDWFEDADVDPAPLSTMPRVQDIHDLVMVFSGEGV